MPHDGHAPLEVIREWPSVRYTDGLLTCMTASSSISIPDTRRRRNTPPRVRIFILIPTVLPFSLPISFCLSQMTSRRRHTLLQIPNCLRHRNIWLSRSPLYLSCFLSLTVAYTFPQSLASRYLVSPAFTSPLLRLLHRCCSILLCSLVTALTFSSLVPYSMMWIDCLCSSGIRTMNIYLSRALRRSLPPPCLCSPVPPCLQSRTRWRRPGRQRRLT